MYNSLRLSCLFLNTHVKIFEISLLVFCIILRYIILIYFICVPIFCKIIHTINQILFPFFYYLKRTLRLNIQITFRIK